MRTITLTQGKVTSVDDEDFEALACYKWYAVYHYGIWYAVRGTPRPHRKQLRMHRVILGEPPGLVDHWDNDGLNNQRSNLRVCTSTQNAQNRRHHRDCISQYKGVSLFKRTGRWRALIRANGVTHYLGSFATDIEAHIAYCRAAEIYFGEFANFKGAREDDN